MADRIHLQILTASGTALDTQASYVGIPTPEGSLGVLKDHAPMICAVGAGRLKYRFEGGESFVSVSGGVARVEKNELTVLVKEARIEA